MSITTVVVETPVVTVITVPSQMTVEVVPERSTLVVDNPVVTVLTVGQQGPAGANGAPGGTVIEMNFAYGDATPATIATAVAGKIVYGVALHIKTAFDGVGATLRVGDAGQLDRLMATAENAPEQVGSNTTTPAYAYGSNTAILLSITPGAGATQGSGVLVLYIQQ